MDAKDRPPNFQRVLLVLMGILAFLGLTIMVFAALLVFQMPQEETAQPLESRHLADSVKPLDLKTPSAFPDDGRIIIMGDSGSETEEILAQEDIPVNNPIELARRIGGLMATPYFKAEIPVELEIGTQKPFWILDVDSNEYREINASLAYKTPHMYFWIEDGVATEPSAVAELAETFESDIYPTNRAIFGSEWSPGVDHDVHLAILFARGLGGAAGYFSSTDSLTREIEPFSNETEMFYLSADYTTPDSPYTYGVLAHEFQHMIHWNVDRNESAWINEGLSELAVELNDFDHGSFSFFFSVNPDLQLNFWPGNDQGDSTPHYGASYLFVKYLMERFGLDSIRALVSSSEIGLAGIDVVFSPLESELSAGFASEKIFQDWSIENFLVGSGLDAGDSFYAEMAGFPPFFPTETMACDSEWHERTVSQFGTDYIAVECPSSFSIELEGEAETPLLPADPFSGDYFFWSNYGDCSDMTLTQTFDFSGVSGEISLGFWTWFDIENDYDYLYLLVSPDGENWDILNPARCSDQDPTGSNYGCGYNGQSNGWINETVDLTRYAGSQVTLQFEYITDLAVNGDGFLIDDVSIDAIGYSTDFEQDEGGWDGQGFVRVRNALPQNYGIGQISKNDPSELKKSIFLGGLSMERNFNDVNSNADPILVVNGLTRVTRQPAVYHIRISSLE